MRLMLLCLIMLLSSSLPAAVSKENKSARVFTPAELAQYDGTGGKPAYVAVDGVVYDVSKARGWKNGRHKAGITAGKDVTREYRNEAPKAIHHSRRILDKLPRAGVLKGGTKP